MLQCLCVLMPLCAWADGPTLQVELLAPPELKQALEENLDIVRWSQRGGLTAGQIEHLFTTAPAQVRDIAATEGYFDARVESSLQQSAEVRLVRLSVEAGEPVLIETVDVAFVGPILQDPEGEARIRHARRAFRIQPGQRFRQADWDEAKARVLRSIARKRYATAELAQSQARIDPGKRTARLKVQVDSGPVVTLGSMRITGLQRYGERLVRNLNPIRAGAEYDEDELLRFQRRLLSSGYFASAIVGSSPRRSAPADTPILVSLVESESRRIELGAGYSTDRNARAQASYRDNNLFDRAWRFSTSLSVDRLVQELH
ncbi:MAG: hypothetical protein KIS79_10225, partial [Burkholderiales bacterium]|nr:hypothetical protein [Burkholderiales bacterium]